MMRNAARAYAQHAGRTMPNFITARRYMILKIALRGRHQHDDDKLRHADILLGFIARITRFSGLPRFKPLPRSAPSFLSRRRHDTSSNARSTMLRLL